jgi:predicted ATPase
MALTQGIAELVGREGELSAIDGALELTREDALFMSVEGEPGIGKTRLLAEAVSRADQAGWLVLEGRASEFEREQPFALFVDALDDYLASLGPRVLDRLEPHALAELSAIFPALRGTSEQSVAGPQEERFRAHSAVRALLESLAVGRSLLLALDDVHWADDASVELLSHLLRRPPRASMLLVFAHRSGKASPRLTEALEEAEQQERLERIEPGGLSRTDAAALIGADLDAEAGEDLYRASGGNPSTSSSWPGRASSRAPPTEPPGSRSSSRPPPRWPRLWPARSQPSPTRRGRWPRPPPSPASHSSPTSSPRSPAYPSSGRSTRGITCSSRT